MDELALKLKIDPVQLRLMNEPEKDESTGQPFSSRHLKECLTLGAEKFGWATRTPAIGSMKDAEGETIGWGVAACRWMATRTDSEATVELRRDGTARVACGTQDIGGGTYTAVAQIVSLETGIPLHKVDVVIGDSALPPGAISGGSWGTASVTPAVLQAAQNAVKRLFTLAASATDSPFKGKSVDDLEFANASVPIKGQTSVEMRLADIFRVANVKAISATAKSVGVFGDPTR